MEKRLSHNEAYRGFLITRLDVYVSGVRLLKSHLELSDTDLMLKVNDSSIKHLSDYSGEKFVSFLRGNDSLAKGMQDKGLQVIPSPEFPQMPDDKTYFGAYNSPITDIYSNLPGHPADVFQMEVHYSIRSDQDLRNDFGDILAEVLVEFYRRNYGKLALSGENLSSWFANTIDADQPAHPRGLISAFVIHLLESIISKVARNDI